MSADEIQVRQYVLGAMDEDTAEEIGRRLFLDSSFAEEVLAIEEELVRDYLGDALPAPIKMQFEERLAVDPVLQNKVMEMRSFSQAIEESVAVPAALAALPRPRGRFAWLRPSRLAWALSLVLAAITGLLAIRTVQLGGRLAALEAENTRLRASQPTDRKLPVPGFELSPTVTMGSSTARRLLIPAAAREVRLSLVQRLASSSGARYRAILQDPDGDEVWSGPAERTDDRVECAIPAEHVQAGDYVLALHMAGPGGTYREIEDYSFAVIRR